VTSLEVLVFPDTGPDSYRTLLANCMYAERVHTLLATDNQVATGMSEAFGPPGDDDPELVRRLRAYFGFVLRHNADFAAMESAGVLIPLNLTVAQAANPATISPSPSTRIGTAHCPMSFSISALSRTRFGQVQNFGVPLDPLALGGMSGVVERLRGPGAKLEDRT
jgi:hypothetical protein